METHTKTHTAKGEAEQFYFCSAFLMASRKICAALLMLSALAWVYIRSVTALPLCPRASDGAVKIYAQKCLQTPAE